MDPPAGIDGGNQPQPGDLQPAADSDPRRRSDLLPVYRGPDAARHQPAHQGTRISGRVRLPGAVCGDGHLQRSDEDDSGAGGQAAVAFEDKPRRTQEISVSSGNLVSSCLSADPTLKLKSATSA